MIHEGKTLKEITTPQVFDPPKEMLVWDNVVECNKPRIQTVYAVIQKATGTTEAIGECCRWSHCAEIPEEPKPRRATNRELEKWLAQGNGEKNEGEWVVTSSAYKPYKSNAEVSDKIKVRKWDDTDWHEPTVDYMGIEEHKQCRKMLYFTKPDYFKETEVKIGNQIWMNKNLDVSDGGEDIYFNEYNGEYYYTWEAAKRIADKIRGWHLPSREEWEELVEATGHDAANLRAESWHGTDKYGFSAVPAGYWNYGFGNVGSNANFWTSEPSGSSAWYRSIDTGTSVYVDSNNQCDGFSVRLMKDM